MLKKDTDSDLNELCIKDIPDRRYDRKYTPNDPPLDIEEGMMGYTDLECKIIELEAGGCEFEVRNGKVIVSEWQLLRAFHPDY